MTSTQDAIAAFLARGGSIDRAPMGASSGFTSRELRKAAQGDSAPLAGAYRNETDEQIRIRAENEQQAALEANQARATGDDRHTRIKLTPGWSDGSMRRAYSRLGR